MAIQIDPSKLYKAKMLKLKVEPSRMKLFSKLMVSNTATNVLNEAPVADKAYSYNR